MSRYDEIPDIQRGKATKLAAAIWMQKYEATEKSFGRVPAGLRKANIANAYELMQACEKIGLKIAYAFELENGNDGIEDEVA